MKYQYDVQVQSSTGEWENINMQPSPSKEEAFRKAERWKGRVVRREVSEWEPVEGEPLFLKIADALSEDGLIKIVIREGAEDGPDVDEHLVIPAGLGTFIMENYDILGSLGNETYQVVKK